MRRPPSGFRARSVSPNQPYLYGATLSPLTGLTLSQGTLSTPFAPLTMNYQASVGRDVQTVEVTPTTADGSATIKVDNTVVASGAASAPIPLRQGANVIQVSVTTAEGTLTYTLTLTRGGPPPLSFLDITTAVSSASPVPTVVQDPTGSVGQPFFEVLHTTGGTGYPVWRLDGGQLPPGIVVAASGAMIGVPTKAGKYVFTVQATDFAGDSITHQVTITVH